MMELLDTYEARIELIINNVLGGKTLTQWCNGISAQYLAITKQKKPPFLPVKLLPHRKAVLRYEDTLTVGGKIEIKDYGFVITLNPQKIALNPKKVFQQYCFNSVLAHELAHTYLYDISKHRTPTDLSNLQPGSGYIEYVCNKIARFLLVPSPSIEAELSKIPPLSSPQFSLGVINDLVQKFQVSSYTLLTRIIRDEALWNCVFVRFQYFPEDISWRLVEIYKPRYLNSLKYFVPPADSRKVITNPKKYPSAKDKLTDFISSVRKTELHGNKRLSKVLHLSDISGPPLDRLFSNLYDGHEQRIHLSIDRQKEIINILIPICKSF